MGGTVGELGEPDALERRVDAGRGIRLLEPVAAQREGDVLAHGGHHDLVVGVREDEADLAPDVTAPAGDVEPVDGHAAALMALRLVLAVALAALYTLTTPVSATLDAMQALLRPFRRWVDADRVGLALALAIRCVPLLAELVREVLEARKARGAEGSILALAVPVIVRALRTAEHLGEALIARGFDD